MSKHVYLERYAWPSIDLHQKIHPSTEMVVVIPAFAEKQLHAALESLHRCEFPSYKVVILVIINEAENADIETQALNQQAQHDADEVAQVFQQLTIRVRLPAKKAGVGLARKIGMDEAARFFESQNKDGVIICYDADCTCETNYFQAIDRYYQHPDHQVGHLHYEHVLNGIHHTEIVQYELHLRYYVNALRVISYPNAIHTLGSCITVRSRSYQKQGGMNTRKAGEDFYFLHKMIPIGGIGEINETTLYPSDRTSDRVPFGTGHAIDKMLSMENFETYHPKIYEALAPVNEVDSWINGATDVQKSLPEALQAFCETMNFQEELLKIREQSGSDENFRQRYYAWWDGFKVLKFIHFARDHFYPNVNLEVALQWLDSKLSLSLVGNPPETQLDHLRAHDRSANFYIK